MSDIIASTPHRRRLAPIPTRKVIQSLLLTAIMAGAFRLSFDAQQTLAIASGIDPDIAWIYPLIIDGAILTGVLVDIWTPGLTNAVRNWVYVAVAFWSITNILGNAIHVLALPPDRVTVTLELALAVNTIPGVTLFLVIHLSRILLVGPPAVKAKRAKAERPQTDVASTTTRATATREDLPPITGAELLQLVEVEHLSYAKIAARVGRSKSWVGTAVLNAIAERGDSIKELSA